MATTSTDWKRLFLREAAWSAPENGISLYETLKTAARAQLSTTATGKILVGTAGNGHSLTFNLPSNSGALTPETVAGTCEDLLTRYELASAYLISTDIPTPTDAQILAQMMDQLVAIRSYTTNFSSAVSR